ncbi:hypothetical protein [Dactylosporangium sp. NPDC048998]|uniref:hypothetical protein n=1 Tax=Dactylosporangium sp. NPDC048998 TaxID=3363976 RepID=UPI00371D7B0C
MPLYLYVDRELLGKISGQQAADAVADFTGSFKVQSCVSPFPDGAKAAIGWQYNNYSGTPPMLAHLALTVLAVTEEPVGPHGVYRRLNELLGLEALPEPPPGYRDVPLMWRVWNNWLSGPGWVYGEPTAREHPRWTLQGWARSQGLVRHSERFLIEEFLEKTGHDRDDPPLVDTFMEWLVYRGSVGEGLREKFRSNATRPILQEVLADEAQRWRRDGVRLRYRAAKRGLLSYDDWSEEFSGVVELEGGWHGVPLDVGNGSRTFGPFDQYVFVRLNAPMSQLLEEGVLHELSSDAAVRFGGREAYAFHEAPSLGGWLQCRRIDRGMTCRVLVHRRRLASLLDAVQGVQPEPSAIDGWYWIRSLEVEPGSAVVALLDLASPGAEAGQRIALVGGLPVGPTTYLVGGEPDVDMAAEEDSIVHFGGKRVPIGPGQRQFSLADLVPNPGSHVLSWGSRRLTLRTVSFVRETATHGGVARPIAQNGTKTTFGKAARVGSSGSLSGACLNGVPLPDVVAVRCPTGSECLVLTPTGRLRQVWPSMPLWLREVGLQPASVDVMYTLRSTFEPGSYFVVRSGRQHMKQVVATSLKTGDRLPGAVRSRARPDLVPELFGELEWRWVGTPDRGLLRALAAAVRAQDSTPAQIPMPQSSAELRTDVVDEFNAPNPYDEVLAWLSEQAEGRASIESFSEAWSWACRRYGLEHLASRWRLGLATLGRLGHVERDHIRRQVAVAPAVLVALPAAAGLHVLAGARPSRLLERLDDPDDTDPIVGSAASSLTVHRRTSLTSDGYVLGPTVVYVEWDARCRESVQIGLKRLGVELLGLVSTQILTMLMTLDEVLDSSHHMEISPGPDPVLWMPSTAGDGRWAPCSNDAAVGLYQYTVHGQRRYGWRDELGRLTLVPLLVGQWLSEARQGRTKLLIHDPIGRRLLVPAGLPPPELVDRALTLRTGLTPYQGRRGRANSSCLVYENVDEQTARLVATLLKQDLQNDDGTLRFER